MNDLRTNLDSLQTNQEQYRLMQDQKLTEQEHAARKIQASIRDLQDIQRQVDITQGQAILRQESALQRPIAQILAAQQRLELKLNSIEAATVERVVQGIASSMIQPTSDSQYISRRSISVSASIMQSKCSDHCGCACHRRSSFRTPQPLHQIFGILFIGYIGIPRLTPSCDTKACIQRSSPTAVVTYVFPIWFLAWAVSLVMRLPSYKGLQFSLAVSRVVAASSAIFHHTIRGNINDIKVLFSHRIASPCDVSYPDGYSVLMVIPVQLRHYHDNVFNLF